MNSSDISINLLNGIGGDVLKSNEEKITKLLFNLSPRAKSIKAHDVERIIAQDDFFLAGAMITIGTPEIIGLGTIYFRETLMKYAGYIEDVVVEDQFRKAGVGTDIIIYLINIAKSKRASAIYLTSGNQREGAHRRWKALQFQAKDSTPFVLYL